MRLSQVLAAAAGLVGIVHGWAGEESNSTAYTTVVTTAYETYCPHPTTFTHKNVTYTATVPTTITITNCPCTFTHKTPPPKHSYYHNTSTTYIVKPPPETTVTTKPPHKTPVGPTTSAPAAVVTAAANHFGASVGGLVIAGIFAMMI